MFNTLPEISLFTIITFLDKLSLENLIECFEKNDRFTYNVIKLRLNKYLRNTFPVLEKVENTHKYLDTINTKKDYMEIFSFIHFNLATYSFRNPKSLIEKNLCFCLLVDKLVQTDKIDPSKIKKFIDIVNYNNNFIFNSKLEGKNYVRFYFNGVKCMFNINLLDDYLSLENVL